jgi:hypothetical protein
MRIGYVRFLAWAAMLSFCWATFGEMAAAAQRPIQNPINNKPREYFELAPYDPTYNARDFSGIWFRVGGARGHGPEGTHPTMTPEGIERMKTYRPTRTYLPDIAPAVANYADTNYPAAMCNPKGFPAIVVDDNHDHHEVIMLPDRILQIWQEERMPREIWMDGREVPSGDNYLNLGPSWLGMSVGNWEGNTLVVETVGLDDRAWLDTFAFPKSDEARMIERYTRTDAETLELEQILYDPKYYTAPWVTDIKVWKKEARNARPVNNFGWYGLFPGGLNDLLCAPMNAFGAYGGD